MNPGMVGSWGERVRNPRKGQRPAKVVDLNLPDTGREQPDLLSHAGTMECPKCRGGVTFSVTVAGMAGCSRRKRWECGDCGWSRILDTRPTACP